MRKKLKQLWKPRITANILEKSCSSVQLLRHVQLFETPWIAAWQASWSFTISQSLLKLMSIESVMPSNHLILCCPLLLLPSIFPSIRIFSNKSVLRIWWPKYWNFSFSISLSNEYSGLISFRIDRFDLLAVQGTLKSLLFKSTYWVNTKCWVIFCSPASQNFSGHWFFPPRRKGFCSIHFSYLLLLCIILYLAPHCSSL